MTLQRSITLDPTGRMLVGTFIRGALATIEAMGTDRVGLNGSTATDLMPDAIRAHELHGRAAICTSA